MFRNSLIAIIIFLVPYQWAQANQINQIYTSNEPLLLEKQPDGSIEGVFADFFMTVAKEAGRDVTMVQLPWKRAQSNAQQSRGGAIGPLTRTSKREANYKWIGVIFPMRIVYVTPSGKPKVTNLEQARTMKVALKGGSAAVYAAKKHGIPMELQEVVPGQQQILNMLLYGRVDVWLVWDVIADRTMMEFAPDAGLVEGYEDVLGDLYLASSLNVSDAEIAHWAKALERVKARGGLEKITKRYLGKALGS